MARWRYLILISLLPSLGCSRDAGKGSSSTITIQVPKALNSASKTGGVGAMSAMPIDRKACYGVIVRGPGINPSSNSSCRPPSGIQAGFAEPGAQLEVSVPKGLDRTIELFAYLQNAGQNGPCPGFAANLTPAQLIRTYKIGVVSKVDMMADETRVEITADFPGLSNHIAQELALPPSCTAGAIPADPGMPRNRPGFDISSGRAAAAYGGAYKLIGTVGKPASRQATGGIYKLVTE